MKEYALPQWILLFFLFSFLGWIFESCYISLHERRFVNRGFFTGPWIPLYGAGGVVMLFIALPFYRTPLLVFIVGIIGASTMEYVTGAVMEAMFGVRYWHYTRFASKNGYISLGSSLCWGGFTLLLTYLGAPWIDRFIYRIPTFFLDTVDVLLLLCFGLDAAFSFRTAFHIRNAAKLLSHVQEELALLQKRLPAGFTLSRLKEAVQLEKEALARHNSAHADDLSGGQESLSSSRTQLAAQLAAGKNRLAASTEQLAEGFTARLSALGIHPLEDLNLGELLLHYEQLQRKREEVLSHLGWLAKQIIKGNPSAASKLSGFAQIKKHFLAERLQKHTPQTSERCLPHDSDTPAQSLSSVNGNQPDAVQQPLAEKPAVRTQKEKGADVVPAKNDELT